MLHGLLKKKTDAPVAGDAAIVDRSILDRRLKNVLARSTRHEFNPPKLSPEDYLAAGYALAPDRGAEAAPETAETIPAGAPDAESAGPKPDETLAMADEQGRELADDGFGDDDDTGEATHGEPAEALAEDSLTECADPDFAPEAEETVQGDFLVAELDAGMEEVDLPGSIGIAEDEYRMADEPVAGFDLGSEQDAPGEPEDAGEPDPGEPSAMDTAAGTADAALADADTAPFDDELEENELDDEVPPVEAIYVTAEAMQADDPAVLTTMVVEEMDYLMFDAGYSPSELPRAALVAWCASFFVADALKEGVGGFAHEAMGEPDLWQACAEGLEAVGASRHLRVYEDLRALLSWDADAAQHVHDDAKYGEGDDHFRELDYALKQAEAEMPLAPLVGTWLKGRPELEVVDQGAIGEAVTALAGHPALAARREAHKRGEAA